MAGFNDVCLPCFISPLKPQIVTLWISCVGPLQQHSGRHQHLSPSKERLLPLSLLVSCLLWKSSGSVCLWEQRETPVDQKPHKSAAFSPDRMCSGYLLKVVVKPYYDLSSLYPMRWLCVSVCLPSCDKGTDSKLLDFRTFTGNAKSYPTKSWCVCTTGICCHWNMWLHDWMWRRSQAQWCADGRKDLCFQPAHVYERKRITHRKDPTSGLQAEWVHRGCRIHPMQESWTYSHDLSWSVPCS